MKNKYILANIAVLLGIVTWALVSKEKPTTTTTTKEEKEPAIEQTGIVHEQKSYHKKKLKELEAKNSNLQEFIAGTLEKLVTCNEENLILKREIEESKPLIELANKTLKRLEEEGDFEQYTFNELVGLTEIESDLIRAWDEYYVGPAPLAKEELYKFLKENISPKKYKAYVDYIEDSALIEARRTANETLAQLRIARLTEEQEAAMFNKICEFTRDWPPFELDTSSFRKYLRETLSEDQLKVLGNAQKHIKRERKK